MDLKKLLNIMKKIRNTTGKQIPSLDLVLQYKRIKKDIDKAIKNVLKNGRFVLGPEVEKFESTLTKYIGTKYGTGVGSGTDALTIALKAIGIKNGDEVVVPANAYPTVFGVSLSGAHIQLADVDPKTLNIDLENIKKVVNKNTKAIVLVHLYGNPVDLDPIIAFSRKNKIKIIEDCAQAIGAEYKGKKVGSFGDISCFSFYPTKNLGAYGDGGAILTNSTKYFQQIKLWRMYGEEKRYKSILIGQNSRLDEIQAAILSEKLKYLEGWNRKRRQLANYYKSQLKNLSIRIVEETPNAKSIYHLFVILDKKRQKLKDFLEQNHIGALVHYPVPIHLTKSYGFLKKKKNDFPISEMSTREVLSLPIYPEMTKKDIDYIVDKIRKFQKKP